MRYMTTYGRDCYIVDPSVVARKAEIVRAKSVALLRDPIATPSLAAQERIENTSTFEHPVAIPRGISAVFMGGDTVAGDLQHQHH